jgi:hypothetical protein
MLRVIDGPSLKASRNDCPSKSIPPEGATLPVTFSSTLSPTFNDRILNVIDCDFEPSAKTYILWPKMSEPLIVPVRFNVEKTSIGMLTSAAPPSITKLRVIAPFISTGTINVPPSDLSGISALVGGVSFSDHPPPPLGALRRR